MHAGDDLAEGDGAPPPARTWMQFFTEVLQIGLIARLVVAGLWLTQGKTFEQRAVLVAVLCAYYLYTVGAFQFFLPAAQPAAARPQAPAAAAGGGAAAAAGGADGNGEVGEGVDAAAQEAHAQEQMQALWQREGLLYDVCLPFLALVLSLSPEWRHPEPRPEPPAAAQEAEGAQAAAGEPNVQHEPLVAAEEQSMPHADAPQEEEEEGEGQQGELAGSGGQHVHRRQGRTGPGPMDDNADAEIYQRDE